MKESFVLWFLYHTAFGRMLLKPLVRPAVSRAAGRYLSSGASKWLVSYYIRKYEIDMRDIEIPRGGFASFNAFFTRKKRTAGAVKAYPHPISPCDGFLSVVKIREHTVFDIKHTEFSLEDLLKDGRLAAKFQDGTALIFRLTPANYHRYCYAADGRVIRSKKIDGVLHCVRPIALRKIPVFAQNSREYQVIRTNDFGSIVQMEVGALLVGKINNHKRPSELSCVRAGEEKGYFEFGGSTIILLFEKNRIRIRRELYGRKNGNGEIPVCMGEEIAEAGDISLRSEAHQR